jgi:hypothetical protein
MALFDLFVYGYPLVLITCAKQSFHFIPDHIRVDLCSLRCQTNDHQVCEKIPYLQRCPITNLKSPISIIVAIMWHFKMQSDYSES